VKVDVACPSRSLTTLAGTPEAMSNMRVAYVVETYDWDRSRTPAQLSHETALDLHDLCDVNPAQIHLTVPAAYRLRRRIPRRVPVALP